MYNQRDCSRDPSRRYRLRLHAFTFDRGQLGLETSPHFRNSCSPPGPQFPPTGRRLTMHLLFLCYHHCVWVAISFLLWESHLESLTRLFVSEIIRTRILYLHRTRSLYLFLVAPPFFSNVTFMRLRYTNSNYKVNNLASTTEAWVMYYSGISRFAVDDRLQFCHRVSRGYRWQ